MKRSRFNVAFWQSHATRLFLLTLVLLFVGGVITPISAQPIDFVWRSGIGGTGEGQFDDPQGIEVDGTTGRLYVADSDNHRIQVLDSSGTFIEMWGWGVATGANAFEVCTANCQKGIFGGGDGQFLAPRDVAVDNLGNVYVAEPGRVQKLDSSGTLLVMWGWGVATGASQFETCSSGCQQGIGGAGDGQFFDLKAIVHDDASGWVYTADSDNHRVQKFDASGTFLLKWGGFSRVGGVAVDSSGNVYASSQLQHKVKKFDSSGTLLLQWGSNGTGPGQFSFPSDIDVDALDNVYVMGPGRFQKFDTLGTFVAQGGSSGNGDGVLSNGTGLAVDDLGHIYTTEFNSGGGPAVDGDVEKWLDAAAVPPPVPGVTLLGFISLVGLLALGLAAAMVFRRHRTA